MVLFRTGRSKTWTACVFVSQLWMAAGASAQPPAQLSGSVLDATGLPLAGATITLGGASNHVAHTNSEGQFEFASLPAGEYELTATLHGFAPVKETTRLTPGQRSIVSLKLTVLILEQTVVTASKTGETDVQILRWR